MAQGKVVSWPERTLELMERWWTYLERQTRLVDRHWKLIVVLTWLGFCAFWIYSNQWNIRWFGLPDTDDNMRIMQVRGLLNGQGWFDLRQYRMNPPFGANIHWSRLVDLPIAGLILTLRLFLDGPAAERWAVAIAPMLPYLLLLFSLAITARRLIAPKAYPFAFLAIFFAASTNGMFVPDRIDHHGWQLALLALSISAVADPKRVRGGLTLGISSALSMAIGLEMIIYLAVLGVVTVLTWVDEAGERDRLRAYAVSLGGATALGFLLFASYDNRNAVCDALSPVWLSDALLGSALMYLLAWLSPADWRRRLAIAFVAGAIIAGFHAFAWPNCLQRLEGISPEAQRLWMSHVKEARPFYRHGWRIATLIIAIPVVGTIGWALLIWLRRNDRVLLRRAIGAALPALVATLLLFWQTRTGPAAQMMSVVGCVALIWFLVPLFWNSRNQLVQVVGTVLVLVIGAGGAAQFALSFVPEPPPTARDAAIGKANRLCGSLWGMRPIALEPKGMVFTFVDLGPRLITVTHHDAVTGPYHRNWRQIVDVMNFWRGDTEQAHRIAAKYRANYVLSCPMSSTTTIFMAEAPKGFYGQLERGQVPNWLQPVQLPKDSPYKMWKVVG
jgi:hypothetical protein